MTGAVILAILLAGGCAYLVGHAFVAARDSFLRTTAGGVVIALCVLFALMGPPSAARMATALTDDGAAVPWASVLRSVWIALVAASLLMGLRVWRMRLPADRRGAFAFDESVTGRVESQLPLADSLGDALDVLARERVEAKHVPRLAASIRHLGARYFHQLPERESEAYTFVSAHAGAGIAADVTGLLLEGAGRRS